MALSLVFAQFVFGIFEPLVLWFVLGSLVCIWLFGLYL